MLQCEQSAAAHDRVVWPPCKAAVHEAIGRAIQFTRRERGHTQEDLALKAGIDRGELNAIEHGKLNPTVDTLLRIAIQLEISAYALLRRAGL
jgi:transcriptional regulator with XRE-family HTH domain